MLQIFKPCIIVYINNSSHAAMDYKINLYNLRENREIKPVTFTNLVAASLYEKR